jgi:NAD(P)-dependent dehydrogenase (short-subunit alcohol dehydrogenase family)
VAGALAGKVCAITGGARGIGYAIAEKFVAEGAQVVIGDYRQAAADEAADRLGKQARTVPLDVRDWASVAAFYQAISADGRLDVSVHSAGINHIADSAAMPEELWNDVIATNLSGAFACCMHAARAMGERGGAIVNISSAASVLPMVARAPYAASKAGLVGLTKTLGAEWASPKIRVNAIGPAWIATDLVAQAIAEGKSSEEEIRARLPMDRLGRPEEVAETALFLADETRSSFFTGSTWYPDGGLLATGIRP